MKLKDISYGPDGVIWVVCVIFAIISVILLSGHGANLIAGYNTATDEQKGKIDEKKLCRVIGSGFLIITIIIFVMGIAEAALPAWSAYAAVGGILLDCVVMIVLANTICKKR